MVLLLIILHFLSLLLSGGASAWPHGSRMGWQEKKEAWERHEKDWLSLRSFPTHVLPVSLRNSTSVCWEVTEVNGCLWRKEEANTTREVRSTWKSHPTCPGVGSQQAKPQTSHGRGPVTSFCQIHRSYQEERPDRDVYYFLKHGGLTIGLLIGW